MGNLKLRKLIERDTIYKDKYKEFRHICKFEMHSILKVFNLDGKCSYYDVVKCNECLSFKSIAKKGNICGCIFEPLTEEQKKLPIIVGKFNYRNLFVSFFMLEDVALVGEKSR